MAYLSVGSWTWKHWQELLAKKKMPLDNFKHVPKVEHHDSYWFPHCPRFAFIKFQHAHGILKDVVPGRSSRPGGVNPCGKHSIPVNQFLWPLCSVHYDPFNWNWSASASLPACMEKILIEWYVFSWEPEHGSKMGKQCWTSWKNACRLPTNCPVDLR